MVVTTGPVDSATGVLDVARQLEVEVDLRVWGRDGEHIGFDAITVVEEVAGPVIAWGGL